MSKVTLPKVVPPLNANYCQRLSVPYNPLNDLMTEKRKNE